ncbi:F-box only protein 4-like [Biomphalaria glabrata]|uniref:F-box only protein 4-like n=1 Tax=Biomphalaria glabrata TaxID=6526 RepID=A0A9U8EAB4_BIOGL|nr:F-box only protein 4-like [Biomphalaria glabrata]
MSSLVLINTHLTSTITSTSSSTCSCCDNTNTSNSTTSEHNIDFQRYNSCKLGHFFSSRESDQFEQAAVEQRTFNVFRSGEKDDINENDIFQFLTSIQNLLLKYRMYSKSQAGNVSSGGLQQFITRKLQLKFGNSGSLTQRLKALYLKDESIISFSNDSNYGDSSFIQCLPINLKYEIFSYLDARSLCMACCVNREWSQLTCDDLLWRHLLQKDVKSWSQISHMTNPKMYQEVNSEWSLKEIYLKCSPEFQKQLRQSNSTFHQVSSVLKYFVPKKVPKVAMFGPGLEQSTSAIVRRMLYEDNPTFLRTAMFPGQFDGVGGGMTLKMPTGHSMHLSVLYSASKHERENRNAQQRVENNRMLQAPIDQREDDPQYELKTQIKHFCQILDGFIFVVDASETRDSVESGCFELMAMVKERKMAHHIPVLILSCIKDEVSSRIPAVEIAELLKLSTLSQPWLVMDCIAETLNAVDTGVMWLIDQSQIH